MSYDYMGSNRARRTSFVALSCLEPALYEAQSTEDAAGGLPPLAVCSRHAEYARQHWNVHYIRTLTPEERTA